jgi:hypothetical protein
MADPAGNLLTELRSGQEDNYWAGNVLSFQTPITDGDWHHVGLVWDGAGTRTLYVDGVEAATQTGVCPWFLSSSSIFGEGFRIGAPKRLNFPGYWTGLIDDVRIYNRAVKP